MYRDLVGMIVSLGKFTCSNGGEFTAPLLSDFAYGDFLLWTPDNDVVHATVLKNDAFSEVSRLVEQLTKAEPVDAAELVQKVFGQVACDPAPSGLTYAIGLPSCPTGAGPLSSWDLATPIRHVEVAEATYEAWNALSNDERAARVKIAVSELLRA